MRKGFILSVLFLLGFSVCLVVVAYACEHGCTPGYWKNYRMHAAAWALTGLNPNQTLGSHFPCIYSSHPEIQALANDTLMDALRYRGGPGIAGAARIMFRHTVAALLNAWHPGVDYIGYPTVQDEVDNVYAHVNPELCNEVDRDGLLWVAEYFRFYNENYPCPLDNSRPR